MYDCVMGLTIKWWKKIGFCENLAVLWWFMIGCKYLDTLKLRWGHFIIFNASMEIERQRPLFSM